MDVTQHIIALTAGIQTFFSPCAFALLPAYISYYLGKEKTPRDGLKLGLTASLGFSTIIIILAALTILVGTQIKQIFTKITPIIAIALIIVGITWILNKKTLTITKTIKLPKSSAYLFGAAYAIAAITCMFPIFLSILIPALTKGPIETTTIYLSYLIGMSTMLTITTLATTTTNQIITKKLKKYKKHVTRISGAIILASGIYLLIQYPPQI